MCTCAVPARVCQSDDEDRDERREGDCERVSGGMGKKELRSAQHPTPDSRMEEGARHDEDDAPEANAHGSASSIQLCYFFSLLFFFGFNFGGMIAARVEGGTLCDEYLCTASNVCPCGRREHLIVDSS